MADDNTETDQIERDLARTRERMDRRLDELGDRLSPNQMVSDALTHVTGGNGTDFAQTLIAKARANPLPAALAGVGLAWLLASGERKQVRAVPAKPDLPTRLRSAEAGVVRMHDEHPEVHASRLDDARGQVLGIARSTSDSSGTYAQRIKDAVASAGQSVREASHDLADGATKAVGRLSDKGHHGVSKLSSITGNPLALGAVAALAGLVAGALIPVSDEEERALGNIAGQLRSKGRGLAQNLVDHGAQVAGDALGAAKESAQAHGLTADKPVGELLGDLKSGELIGQVKQAAQEVANAGKDSLQSHLETQRDGGR